MKVTPSISVVIVFHRETPFFRPALESVFAQTLSDWEMILVDNGAGLSASVLGGFRDDPRIIWVRLPKNLGIPSGHNAGVKAARSELIALLDYDDIMLPDRLELQVALLRARIDVGLVSSQARRIDKNDTVVGEEFSLLDSEEQRAFTAFAAPVVTPAYSGRREIFLRYPYREFLPWAADLDFLARAAEDCKLAAVPEVLFHYRWHSGQTTQQKTAFIEQNLVVIRLMTARRRAGQSEGIEKVQLWLRDTPQELAASNYWGARLALQDHLYDLTAYFCRRIIASSRNPFWLARAALLAAAALVRAGKDQRSLVAKHFFFGPVKALGLHPAKS